VQLANLQSSLYNKFFIRPVEEEEEEEGEEKEEE
jgi:hypothetical protein